MSGPREGSLLPAAALMFNAFVWGVSWWPFRQLQSAGVHPLWATTIIYLFALACLLCVRPAAWRGLWREPALWLLALASGVTNVGFNWAVTIGDVVRVVLLFYLMPAWSVLLAWALLGEKPTAAAMLRLVLAFVGVGVVLLPASAMSFAAGAGLSVADALALLGGFSFALTNVMLRKLRAAPSASRMLAMFGGGALLAGLSASLGVAAGTMAGLPPAAPGWAVLAGVLALAFLVGNYALQYGAARLAAGTTSIVMLTEVVFASASSVALGAAAMEPRTWIGGTLIVLAALLAAFQTRN
ncbi:MAG TPA: DMT family transporter [Burkholderiaceae bacterium]|nr:DMT family transporter [Burkholderiaceae bacterium]